MQRTHVEHLRKQQGYHQRHREPRGNRCGEASVDPGRAVASLGLCPRVLPHDLRSPSHRVPTAWPMPQPFRVRQLALQHLPVLAKVGAFALR
jgi:hypothetical protein